MRALAFHPSHERLNRPRLQSCRIRSAGVGAARRGMDTAFVAMLFLTATTGLLLTLLRTSPAMGLLLAIHLGVVFSLFVTMPYGKFVHGLYRTAALMRYAAERRKIATVE